MSSSSIIRKLLFVLDKEIQFSLGDGRGVGRTSEERESIVNRLCILTIHPPPLHPTTRQPSYKNKVRFARYYGNISDWPSMCWLSERHTSTPFELEYYQKINVDITLVFNILLECLHTKFNPTILLLSIN